MNPLTVTPLYAGLLALWFLALSMRVVQQRGHGVSLGHGNDEELLRRIRGHGNFSEYVPIILVLLALLELGGLGKPMLHVMGAALLAARLLHGISLSFTQRWKFGRFWGTTVTFVLLLVTGGLCIWQAVA